MTQNQTKPILLFNDECAVWCPPHWTLGKSRHRIWRDEHPRKPTGDDPMQHHSFFTRLIKS